MTQTSPTSQVITTPAGQPLGEVFDTAEAARLLLKIRVEYFGFITPIDEDLITVCRLVARTVVDGRDATHREDIAIRQALHTAKHQAFMADLEAAAQL